MVFNELRSKWKHTKAASLAEVGGLTEPRLGARALSKKEHFSHQNKNSPHQ